MMNGMHTDGDVNTYNTDLRKSAIIDSELSWRQVSIAALQETRFTETDSIKKEHYTFLWFGKASVKPCINGTAFAVWNNLLSTTQTPYAVNDHISVQKLNSQQGGIRIINVYAPTFIASADDKGWFYIQLEDTIRQLSCFELTILLRDMNARFEADCTSWPDCISKFEVGKINENWQSLLELCSRNSPCITTFCFLDELTGICLGVTRNPKSGISLALLSSVRNIDRRCRTLENITVLTVTLIIVLLSPQWDSATTLPLPITMIKEKWHKQIKSA